MILYSHDLHWVDRLRHLTSLGGWPFELMERLPRAADRPSEHALVVLDRALAPNPARAVRALRAAHPAASVALACADAELGADAVALALASGADETIGKSWTDTRLLARLGDLRDRAFASAVRVSVDGALKAELRSRRAFARARGRWTEIELAAAEFALLWELLSAGGRMISREKLLEALRGAGGREVEIQTVARRVHSLRRALVAGGWKGEIETVRGGFYRLGSSAAPRRRSTT